MKYYILFGPPGAGKGTQAEPMEKKYGFRHISTGQLLRDQIAAGTELGKKAAALIDKGNFVPDEVVEAMIFSVFEAEKDAAGFILDGFPRTLAQAEVLDAFLSKRGESVDGVISIHIPDSTVFERIKHRAMIEGRADDADDAIISNRVKTYHAKTEPLISYYRAQGKFREVDGLGSVEEVSARIDSLMQE
ncbi:MAG: adenylate kinase [Bacteroidales bacterium]|nr:adenylate kinase [Bacteroidales bacterium]